MKVAAPPSRAADVPPHRLRVYAGAMSRASPTETARAVHGRASFPGVRAGGRAIKVPGPDADAGLPGMACRIPASLSVLTGKPHGKSVRETVGPEDRPSRCRVARRAGSIGTRPGGCAGDRAVGDPVS